MAALILLSATSAALLLAVLQGLTEFLPISSSGHLVIAQKVLGRSEFGLAFDVALHLGTLFAVVWAYRRDLWDLVRDLRAGRTRMLAWLLLASVPAGLIGVLCEDYIEQSFHSSRLAGVGLCVTALVLFGAEQARQRSQLDSFEPDARPLRWRDALIIGCAQAVAILPGISRSGSTIAAGLFCGIPAPHAARLSFLMSIIAVGGACVLKLPDLAEASAGGVGTSTIVSAVLISAIVGWAALRFLLVIVARGALRWFALYCALVGATVLVFL